MSVLEIDIEIETPPKDAVASLKKEAGLARLPHLAREASDCSLLNSNVSAPTAMTPLQTNGSTERLINFSWKSDPGSRVTIATM